MTTRQQEVWALIAQGKTNRDIGQALSLAEKTVKTHVTGLFKEIGVQNRTQAALKFMRLPALQEAS